MEEAVGDWAVYYEPRRDSGRSSYFAIVRVDRIDRDQAIADHYYARLSGYLDFDAGVPWQNVGGSFERALIKADGSTNAGAFGWSVRRVPQLEFDQIVLAGFSPVIEPTSTWQQSDMVAGFAEEQLEWEPRPLVERVTSRPFRDMAFSHRVRQAYQNRCAISGLDLTNGGGRPEVQAAHIRPVAAGGPDSARNGIALSGTVHWMFDRGLISIDEDHRLLIGKAYQLGQAMALVEPGRPIWMPPDPSARPHPEFLNYHRTHIFKG